MARDFKLPDIGEGLTEAEIVRWLVAEGETVEADQPIVEVETDKAVVEIPSPYAGVVLQHGGTEGDVIEVGAVLVVIGDEGETAPSPAGERTWPEPPVEPEPAPSTPRSEPSPIVGTLSEEAETISTAVTAEPPTPGAVKALPIVRKLARDNDIDLEHVTGTGPNGRITREDVEAAISDRSETDVEKAGQPVPPPVSDATVAGAVPQTGEPEARPTPPEADEIEEVGEPGRTRMSRLRRTIAAHMSLSWSEIPHVTTFDDIDGTRFLEVREALGDRHGVKIPVEALAVKAVLPALDEFPEFNATLDGEEIVLHEARDIGIAVDTPDGLLIAVIKDAGSRSVLDLASEVRRLGEGAKGRSLAPDELGGQTFTISNIGAVGGGHGTPIVPHGTTAILSIGRARERPIVDRGDLVIAPMMPLSLSYDHRVIDGAQGRRFMALVMENLEEPALFLA